MSLETKGVTRAWKVYGFEGHRQKLSFWENSEVFDFTENNNIRIIEIFVCDVLKTHDYVVIRITRNNYKECEDELMAQLSDGFFENSRVGRVVEV